MENILLLTDFTDLAGYAKSMANKVALAVGAKLHVLKIVDIPSEVMLTEDGKFLECGDNDITEYQQELEASEKSMKSFKEDIKAECTCDVRYGRFYKDIEKYVAENNIDLIVIGTHGADGVRELLTGSRTEHIIMNVDVPVLSLKCDRDNIVFHDVLITGTFNLDSDMNLELVQLVQKVFGSTIHMLMVNTKNEFKTQADGVNHMRAFADKNGLGHVKYHFYNDKSLEDGLVNFINNYDMTHELEIDLVAVEKKDKTALGYLFTGCSATSIVNHIFKPIVTYKAKKG